VVRSLRNRTGCNIYDSRPAGCRKFLCTFLMDDRLPEDWRPSKSKIVLVIENDGYRRVAHLDPDRPAAPCGKSRIALSPGRDWRLGRFDDAAHVHVIEKAGPLMRRFGYL